MTTISSYLSQMPNKTRYTDKPVIEDRTKVINEIIGCNKECPCVADMQIQHIAKIRVNIKQAHFY